MATAKRIQMKEGVMPEQIIDPQGIFLGNFSAGLGYWVTPQNQATVDIVIADGRAVYVDPDTAPFPAAPGGVVVKAAPGQVGGSVSVGKPATPTGGLPPQNSRSRK